jgi:hypothetical protein
MDNKKKCEKCGKTLPVDTPSSVYSCSFGSGCNDIIKVREKSPDEEGKKTS